MIDPSDVDKCRQTISVAPNGDKYLCTPGEEPTLIFTKDAVTSKDPRGTDHVATVDGEGRVSFRPEQDKDT